MSEVRILQPAAVPEAFRQLRTNLRFVDVDNPRKVILITSALPGEGKTTTVVNLAIALVSAEGRVLVIDADLRRTKVADLLGLDSNASLTSVLSGQIHLDQGIQRWGDDFFDVLTSGPVPPNPSELLASNHMGALLRDLRHRYDVVLIDSPPLLPLSDAAAVVPATDGAILICRYGRTTRPQVDTAVAALRSVSAPLLGTVFTMVPSSGPRAYAQYNSYYRAEKLAHSTPAPSTTSSPRVQEPQTELVPTVRSVYGHQGGKPMPGRRRTRTTSLMPTRTSYEEGPDNEHHRSGRLPHPSWLVGRLMQAR